MPDARRPLEDITVDDLVACLREAGTPLGARRLRTALRLDPWCLPAQLTRFLGDAVRTGRVVRSGTGPATRYSAAEEGAGDDDEDPGPAGVTADDEACVGAGGADHRTA